MSVLQVMHIMYIRDIPNTHDAFIIHAALPNLPNTHHDKEIRKDRHMSESPWESPSDT